MNMMRKFKLLRDKERGQNFVEIALTLPILIALLTGMMEIGFLVHSVSTVATAAREGARYGARGMYIDPEEIASVAQIAMELSLDVNMDLPNANTRIIVTHVDIDPDGTYHYLHSETLGDLAVASKVCLASPCGEDTINVDAITVENVEFNDDVERCNEIDHGCRNDLVIVEVFYAHELKMGLMMESFIKYVMPTPIIIEQHSIMRVLTRRSPWSAPPS